MPPVQLVPSPSCPASILELRTHAQEEGQCLVPWSAVLGKGEGRVHMPGHRRAPGCCPHSWCPSGRTPLPDRAGLVEFPSGAFISLCIFRSKMLFNCEKAKGSRGRGSQAAVIGQLLPQTVPLGPAASGGQRQAPSRHNPHWEPLLVPKLMPPASTCRECPGHPHHCKYPHPFQPPWAPRLSCTHPSRGWRGLMGADGGRRSLGSSSQAPAAVFSQVKVQCFEIFYFEQQSWRSGAALDPWVSAQSRAGSWAGRARDGCCP